MSLSLAAAVVAALLPARLAPQAPAAAAPREAAQEKGETYVCPPCGADCHATTHSKPGSCGVCGMALVPIASVAQIGVLLYADADLSSCLVPLALLASSDAGNLFTLADTAEPMRIRDALEVTPQHALADAPPLDVLVVPGGYGAWDDPLIVEWVKASAARARFVLADGAASVVLARAGFLAGERVPAPPFVAQRGAELAPGLSFDGETAWRRSGKFFLARDPDATIDATLALIAELGGEPRAARVAAQFGRAWKKPDGSAR